MTMKDIEREAEELQQARSELSSTLLAKQKEVVTRMGSSLEKIRKGEQPTVEELDRLFWTRPAQHRRRNRH